MKEVCKNRILLLCVLAFIVSAFTSCSKQDKVVVSYNTPQNWVNWGDVLTQFSAKTGITAPNDNKNSGQTLTALISEKGNPLCDVAYFGIVFGINAVKEGVLQNYKSAYFDKIDPSLKDAAGQFQTIHFGSIAFLCNTEALGGTPVPRSWADLLKPEYKDKIGFLDPTSAAVGYSVCTALNIAMGGTLDNWSPAFDYLQKLKSNNVIYPKQTSTARLMKGEIPILIDADFNGYGLKYSQDGPIEVVIPAEGSLRIPYVIALVKGAPHEENGKKLIDYIMSAEGQRLFAQGFVRPIDTSALTDDAKSKFLPDSDYARVKDVDYGKMAEVQEAFNARWIAEISQ
jgi:putative spermidine/putrescine transport system substrate-binding protein